jgi:hypothetical protein
MLRQGSRSILFRATWTQQNPAFCLGMLGKICEENAVEAGSDLVF